MAEESLAKKLVKSADRTPFEVKEGFPVKLARLHVPMQAPGVFSSDKVLSQQKTKGIEMKYDGFNLWWSHKGQWGAIPSGSISEVIFE